MNSMNILILFGEGPIKKIRKTLEKNKKLRIEKKTKNICSDFFGEGHIELYLCENIDP